MKYLYMRMLTVVLGLFLMLPTMAQSNFTVDPSSTMTITGTSSMHDWDEDVTEINGTLAASVSGKELTNISAFTLTVPVESIESGKSIMDNKTYDALKYEEHPQIEFELLELSSIQKVGSNYMVKGKGKLTIAGVTQTVDVMAAWGFNDDGQLLCRGGYTIDMTDYEMEPPVAMMGAMKVGEKVNVKYDLIFTAK